MANIMRYGYTAIARAMIKFDIYQKWSDISRIWYNIKLWLRHMSDQSGNCTDQCWYAQTSTMAMYVCIHDDKT